MLKELKSIFMEYIEEKSLIFISNYNNIWLNYSSIVLGIYFHFLHKYVLISHHMKSRNYFF
jgi:hypothetical protein